MLLIDDHASDSPKRWTYNRLVQAPLSPAWNDSAEPEAKVHRIHAYPARFPAFLVHKSLEEAYRRGIEVRRVADPFCGSGTVTHEAAARNFEVWGCDVNPVATMIARVKATGIDPGKFRDVALRIAHRAIGATAMPPTSMAAADRLSRWYRPEQFEALARLRNAMLSEVGVEGREALAFACAFSAVVKPASQWRSRSTKPAHDPAKSAVPVAEAFGRQCLLMIEAWSGARAAIGSTSEIVLGDVTKVDGPGRQVDLIVTSPPYATSYDYADLHQLSSLWLGFAEDHRDLRANAIGAVSRRADLMTAVRDLNTVGMHLVFSLFDRDRATAEALAAYLLDMQRVARRCYGFLRPGGLAVFVLGNAHLVGVRVDAANHLVESLLEAGFADVRVARRRPGTRKNTPYRSADGRLSSSRTGIEVYAEEYVLMAQRP